MYHHVNWHAGDLVTLTPEDFEKHLQILSQKGVETLFLDGVVEYLRGRMSLSQPAVALTFDDGHLDNWVYAFPLLKKYQMKATIFVITSWMGEEKKRPQWNPDGRMAKELPQIPLHRAAKRKAAEGDSSVALSWEEARAMEATGLVDIQSHTHFHRDYFFSGGKNLKLDPQKRELLIADLARSKTLTEDRLKKKCRYLSWPWGKYDAEALAMAKELGFEAMVTTEKGVNFPGSDEMVIKRIVAKSGDSWFSQRLRIYSHRTIGHIYSRVAGRI
jgi:peptidoglycan/xylan/chitin deacetylase (PgdA/CDA1 family)